MPLDQAAADSSWMETFRAYRTELDTTDAQRALFARHAGVSRWAYNWGLERKAQTFRETGQSLDAMKLHKELNRLKATEYPWLYETSKCAPQEALRDLDRAFQNFWRARREGQRCGFPRFKSRKRSPSSFRLTGKIRVSEKAVRLPRLGWIRLKERGYIPIEGVRILSATLSERAGRWFVSVRVEQSVGHQVVEGPVVGADLGVLRWVTLSDGTVWQAPASLARLERRLSRAQRALSRKRKTSRNRRKASVAVARLAFRLSNTRRDALHKITTQLARTKSVVVVEQLNVSGMLANRRLAHAVSSRTFASFRQMLEYKARWYGSKVVLAPRFYPSSKRCSCVGCENVEDSLVLAQRTYTCSSCGCSRDRDLNAALNLRNVAGSFSDTLNACGGDVRPSLGWQSPVSQESGRPLWKASEERCSVNTTSLPKPERNDGLPL
jgi:putative transposase